MEEESDFNVLKGCEPNKINVQTCLEISGSIDPGIPLKRNGISEKRIRREAPGALVFFKHDIKIQTSLSIHVLNGTNEPHHLQLTLASNIDTVMQNLCLQGTEQEEGGLMFGQQYL